jgi:hypothetical protein
VTLIAAMLALTEAGPGRRRSRAADRRSHARRQEAPEQDEVTAPRQERFTRAPSEVHATS